MKDLRNHSILVIESSNTGMIIKTSRLSRPGEMALGGTFFMNSGGKGANQAIAVTRLEGQVLFTCKTGSDVLGYQSQQLFEGEGIDTFYIFSDPGNPSGVALIVVDAHAENCIVVTPGANANLLPPDLTKSEEAIEEADLILMQLETPMDTVEFVAKMASKKNKRVILNPAPAQILSATLLRHPHMITPNEAEIEVVSGAKIADEVSAKKTTQVTMETGAQDIIVALGSKGALIYCDSMVGMVPAIKVGAVDTTAVGDIFNGTLTVALTEGRDLREAVRFACKASVISMARVGTQSPVPYRSEADVFD